MKAYEHTLLLMGGKGGAPRATITSGRRATTHSFPEWATRGRRWSCGSLSFWEDVLLRQAHERVLICAAQYPPTHPVPPKLGGGLQDEVAEHPRAHGVRSCTRWWLVANGPEEEPDTSCIGVGPGRMGPTTEPVVRKQLKRRRIRLMRPTAAHLERPQKIREVGRKEPGRGVGLGRRGSVKKLLRSGHCVT